jgi:hypothetical protein
VRADFDLGAGRQLCGGRDRHVWRSPMLGPNQSTMPDLPPLVPRQTSSIPVCATDLRRSTHVGREGIEPSTEGL